MTVSEIVLTIFVTVFGAGGIVTVYLNHRLNTIRKRTEMEFAEKKKQEDAEAMFRREHQKLESAWRHALGRIIFWMNRSMTKGEPPNGELKSSYEEFEMVEQKIKELENDRVAEMMDK